MNRGTNLSDAWRSSRSNTKLFDTQYDDFPLTTTDNKPGQKVTKQGFSGIIARNVEQSPLSKFFFSQKNIEHLRDQLCKQVVKKFVLHHGKKVKTYIKQIVQPEGQSLNEIAIIMKSIYYQHARNLAEMWSTNKVKAKKSVLEQTAVLNMEFLLDQVPRMYSSVSMYVTYQRDVTSQPLPLSNPVSMGSAGTKMSRGPADIMF